MQLISTINIISSFIQEKAMIKGTNLNKLMSISIQLAAEACEIVKKFYVDQDAKQYTKGINDCVTQADYKVQTMLINGLKSYFPQIKIVGEEEKDYEGQINVNYAKFQTLILQDYLKIKSQPSTEDLCIWIDPIDCTKGFIKGDIQDVTILIGVSYKNKAQLGVIGVPYKFINGERLYSPSIIFGSATEKFAYQYFLQTSKCLKIPYNLPSIQKTPLMATSCNRTSPIEVQLLKAINAENLRCGGSGRKVAMILNEGVSLAIYPFQSYTSKWDTCAGQAIVRGAGGYFSDCVGDQIIYNPQNPKQINSNGYLCSFNKKIFDDSINFCTKYRASKL